MPIGSPVEGRTALTDQKVETTILTKIWPLNGEILIGVARSKQVFQDQLAARAGTGVRLWFAEIGQSGKSAIPRKTHPSAARFFVFAGVTPAALAAELRKRGWQGDMPDEARAFLAFAVGVVWGVRRVHPLIRAVA